MSDRDVIYSWLEEPDVGGGDFSSGWVGDAEMGGAEMGGSVGEERDVGGDDFSSGWVEVGSAEVSRSEMGSSVEEKPDATANHFSSSEFSPVENSQQENSQQLDEPPIDLLNDLLGHLRMQMGSWVENERRDGRNPEDQQAHAEEVIARWLSNAAERRLVTGEAMLTESQERHLAKTALSYTFGAGPWERYINDPNLSDIHINGHDTVWLVDRSGKKHRGEPVAASNEELIQQIRWAGASLGRTSRRFDMSSPVLNMRLPNGSRLHAIMDVSMVPMVTIRMHDPTLSTLSQLKQGGMFGEAIENFLRAAVLSRHNIVICGGMGTGKTTLCRALLNEIPPEDRIVTVEDELELGIHQFSDLHPDVGVLEARPANLEGAGEFSLESLLRECLRMHADRIVVGEVRGTEVLGMLLAMTSGQDGSLCTIHANSTKEAFERLAMYASMTAQHYSQAFTYRLVGSAVNFVIHIGRWEGQRYITSIREVIGSTENHVQSNEIWRPGPDGKATPSGEPLRVEPTLRRLEAHGFDRTLMESSSRVNSSGVNSAGINSVEYDSWERL